MHRLSSKVNFAGCYPNREKSHTSRTYSERRSRNACAPGEWYGSRAADDRSVSSPTSTHRQGLCRQDWLGRGDQSVGADRDGYRSRDHCAGHDPRYLEWAQSLVPDIPHRGPDFSEFLSVKPCIPLSQEL